MALTRSSIMALLVDAGAHGHKCTELMTQSPERKQKKVGMDPKIAEQRLSRSYGMVKPPEQVWRGLK